VQTVYDWLTVAIFAGLITLFLQRSSADEPKDKLQHYAPAAIGCAIANYLGNQGQDILAAVCIVGIAVYVWLVLKPLAH
jgi:uncharacterized BrkB/YihY/UPF0761 family membrane protein